jgi:hypothetical protein
LVRMAVAFPVHLHSKADFRTVEVQDVNTHRVLPAKSEASNLGAPQM